MYRVRRTSLSVEARHAKRRRAALLTGAIIAGWVLFTLYNIALMSFLNYERTHDMPNPIWGIFTHSYTYTPATASHLNPDLLKTRPDLVFLRYVHDYIQLVGTFPCEIDVPGFTGAVTIDPILTQKMRSCPVKRIVTDVLVTSIYVGIFGVYQNMPGARVAYTVSYADGTYRKGQDLLDANLSQPYYLSHIHLTCWDSLGISLLYSYVLSLSQVPSGVEYSGYTSDGEHAYRCKL